VPRARSPQRSAGESPAPGSWRSAFLHAGSPCMHGVRVRWPYRARRSSSPNSARRVTTAVCVVHPSGPTARSLQNDAIPAAGLPRSCLDRKAGRARLSSSARYRIRCARCPDERRGLQHEAEDQYPRVHPDRVNEEGAVPTGTSVTRPRDGPVRGSSGLSRAGGGEFALAQSPGTTTPYTSRPALLR